MIFLLALVQYALLHLSSHSLLRHVVFVLRRLLLTVTVRLRTKGGLVRTGGLPPRQRSGFGEVGTAVEVGVPTTDPAHVGHRNRAEE